MKKTISYLFMGASVVTLLALGSCSKKDSTLPAINGYNSSNDVASANLVAHWTFDGTTNEVISNTAPTTATGNTFGTGMIGQGLTLSSGYLLYPTLTALNNANAIGSFTISVWISNVVNNGTTATQIFGLTQGTDTQSDWNTGPIQMLVQTGQKKAGDDTLVLDPYFATYIGGNRYGGDNVTAGGFADIGKKWVPVVETANAWIHYVAVYDGAGSNVDIYANGVLSSNSDYRNRTYNNGTATVGIGPVVMTPPIQAIIGGFPAPTTGFSKSPVYTWQALMSGSMDDLRLYSKVLTPTEIGSLFQLGQAGR